MLILGHLLDALRAAGQMFWQVLWPLAAGFLLSAVVEAVVSKQSVARRLGHDDVRSLAAASAFGAASSSCSYAAVALARSLFRKGATLRNAVIFEFASTNLVFELGLALLVLLGWQFVAGEFAGGLVMIALLALLFSATLRPRYVAIARHQAAYGRTGRMEGHAAMDMSVAGSQSMLRRLLSPDGRTAISHYYFMNIYSVWFDLLLGFLIAGALAAWVPSTAWQTLFFSGHGALSTVVGALVGPVIALLTFVCSVGNVPVAAVLWRAGISFAGAIAFIFGDLLIIPIIDIHRRYYGASVSAYIALLGYVAMVCAGLIVGFVFGAIGATPASHQVSAVVAPISLDATTVLNIAALVVTALLLIRFVATGGPAMLQHMNAHPMESTGHASVP